VPIDFAAKNTVMKLASSWLNRSNLAAKLLEPELLSHMICGTMTTCFGKLDHFAESADY